MVSDWLNYHHLRYFWTVAKEGSIAKACTKLELAQPTVSTQIRSLEVALGERLFARSGRGLELTETGRLVYRYAEEIFTLGREMVDTLHGRPTGRPLRLNVGIADVLPKIVSRQLLQPALNLPTPVHLVCREDKPDRLLMRLAAHEFDVVLSDAPLNPVIRVQAFNHFLGQCGVSFLAGADLAQSLKKPFPRCLDGAPLLLPTDNTTMRRALDQWFDRQEVRPRIVGEFEDTALMKVFGQAGHAVFPIHNIVEDDVCRQYDVRCVGRVKQLKQLFYAISLERKLKHPAVVAISKASPLGPPRED